MTFKPVIDKPIRTKGRYIVWVEDNGDGSVIVYSTDSPFWRDFFD